MAIKFTNWPQYIPNGHKICQHISLQDTQNLPKMYFGFENVPSDNPDVRRQILNKLFNLESSA
jgi:hypothetical protein